MDVLCGMGGLPPNNPITLNPYKNVRYVSFLVTVIQHMMIIFIIQKICNLARLSERRENLCLSFMKKINSFKYWPVQTIFPPIPAKEIFEKSKKVTRTKAPVPLYEFEQEVCRTAKKLTSWQFLTIRLLVSSAHNYSWGIPKKPSRSRQYLLRDR